MLGLLENMDRKTFEIIGFNLNISNNKSKHLINYFDSWHHVHDLKDIDLINFIRRKNINILIMSRNVFLQKKLQILFPKILS